MEQMLKSPLFQKSRSFLAGAFYSQFLRKNGGRIPVICTCIKTAAKTPSLIGFVVGCVEYMCGVQTLDFAFNKNERKVRN